MRTSLSTINYQQEVINSNNEKLHESDEYTRIKNASVYSADLESSTAPKK